MMVPVANDVTTTQLNQLPNQEKVARRVSFPETLPRHRAASNEGDDDDEQERRCRPRLFTCCACTCLVVFGIVLALLIIIVIFMSFLQSGLPEIRIQNLEVSKFEMRKSSKNEAEALLSTRVNVSIEIRNKNEKMELSYSNMRVRVAAEGVELGKSEIAGFSHNGGNSTHLKVRTRVVREVVERESALQVEEDRKEEEMVVEVTMEGRIEFHVGMLKAQKVPIMVACQVEQFLLVNQVNGQLCTIRMFPTR